MKIRNPEIRKTMSRTANPYIEFAPLAADDNFFAVSQDLDDSATGVSTTAIAVGDWTARTTGYPTTVVTVLDEDTTDSWTAATMVLVGSDQFGDTVSETITGTNSSGTWTLTSSHAYIKVNSCVITVTGTVSTGDVVIIGYVKTVGLGVDIGATTDVIIHNFDGANDAGTVGQNRNTYLIAGTPDAAKLLRFYIKQKLN